tara:strand:+ start:11625 stop:11774 length:150 start_codon:yes stop_codon:yes gene_type:complete
MIRGNKKKKFKRFESEKKEQGMLIDPTLVDRSEKEDLGESRNLPDTNGG